jgi:peptidyl-prolyl cis-trans isomerase D
MLTVLRRHHRAILIGVCIFIIPAFVMWGGASRMGARGPGEGEVAKVNGAAITEQELTDAVRRIGQNLREAMGQNYDPDLFGSAALTQQALGQLISEKLVIQESKRLGTRVTRKDIEERLRSLSLFQVDGKFDADRYNAFVSQERYPWSELYEDLEFQMRHETVLADVEGGAKLTETELRNEYRMRNEQVKVKYFALNPSQFESEVAVTEQMLKDYYDANRANYIEPEKVRVKYVEARVEASKSDRQAVHEKARTLLARAEAGEQFVELAKRYSEAPDAAEKGGEMDWVEESLLPDEVASAVAELENDDLSDIVETQQGVHIYKCEGRKEDDGKKQIKLRRIEFALAASAETRDKITSQVDTLLAEANSSKSLETAAETVGMEVKETPLFGKSDRFIQGIRPNAARSFVSAASALEKTGDLSYVIRTPDAFYLLELIEIQENRLRELSEVEELVRNRVVRQEALVLASKRADEIASQITSLGDVEGVDENLASSVRLSEPFTRRGYIPGVVGDREFHNVAFASELGELSGPILGRNGVYFLEVVERIPIDTEKYEQEKEKLRESLLAQRKRMLSADWQRWLQRRADIRTNNALIAEYMGGE